jgi:hypothetical protein
MVSFPEVLVKSNFGRTERTMSERCAGVPAIGVHQGRKIELFRRRES